MIVIWDNGGSYSDHRICFVDAGDRATEFVNLLAAGRFREDRARVLAVAELIAWRDPSAAMTPASFYDDNEWSFAHDPSCPEYDYGDGPCTCWVRELRAFCEERQG